MAWVYEDKYVNVEWEHMEIQTLVQELPYVERAQKKPVETYKAFPQRDLSRVFYRQLEVDILHLIFKRGWQRSIINLI